MPSVFKRFSTIINRDKDKDKDKDKKDKRKSLGSALGGTIRGKKEEKPAPLKSEGKRIVVVSGASVGLGVELVKRFVSSACYTMSETWLTSWRRPLNLAHSSLPSILGLRLAR